MREHQIRQCMLCRERAPKETLLRFVFHKGQLVWDERQNIQSRGLYLHDRVECLTKAGDVGRWIRALRLESSEAAAIGRGAVSRVLELMSARAMRRI